MALPPRGLPILSGPPPIVESPACRQCGQAFNPLWRRAHACGHCGYEYCSSCLSDGQALMPRRARVGGAGAASGGGGAGGAGASGVGAMFAEGLADIKDALGIKKDGGADGPSSGYDVESVCLPCLSMLQVTAAPVQTLRSLPIKRLKDYLAAYDIPCVGPREKEDFVQAVLKARNPQTGCLAPEQESYYRRKSVLKHNQAAAPNGARPAPSSAARPAAPRPAQPPFRPPYAPRTAPAPARPAPQAYPSRPAAPRPAVPRPAAPSPARPPPPRAAASPAPPPPAPPPPVPTILSLVALPKSYLSSLSIGTLKAILYDNHVRVDYGQVLEKTELINRVSELIDDERRRLERQRLEEEQLARPAPAAAAAAAAAVPNGDPNGTAAAADAGVPASAPAAPASAPRVPTGPASEPERGLCVVCQDGEATLAVVDCGHLAMCADCAELVLATSRECPLCRTRIVTPQRLIRIYRT